MPESGDAERLVILLEAKVSELEKNMAKASGVTARAYREMSLGSKRATTQMENDMIRSSLRINQALATTSSKIGAFGRSFAGGLVGPVASLLTLSAAVNGTKAALDKFGKVADQSAAGGIDPEFFQGLAYQANLAGIETDALAGAMATFAKNAGLAAEGKGRMVTTLEALNPELLESIKHASSQEERFRLVADAIKDAKNQAEAAAIASAAFGDQGVRIAAAFKDGSAAIDETMEKARELGIIVDRDVIAKADEYGDKWDTAAQIIDTKVKIALTNLAPGMVWLVDRMADLTQEAMDFADALKTPQDFVAWLGGGSGAESRLRGILRGMMADADPDPSFSVGPNGYLTQDPDRRMSSIGPGLSASDLDKWFNVKLRDLTPPMPDGGSGETAAGEAFDFRAFLDGQYERSLEGFPDIFDRTTEAAGRTASAMIDNADAVTELAQRWEAAEEMAQGFASTLLSGLREGKSAVQATIDAVADLGFELARMSMRQGISGLFSMLSGGLGGGFGAIAAGAAVPMGGFVPGLTGPRLFARGTANTGGRRGEPIGVVHGQEAVIPLPAGGRVPVQLTSTSSPAERAAPSVLMTVKIDARGAQQGVGLEIKQALREFSRYELPMRFAQLQRNPDKK